ncbi:MAG: hypothetical protein WAO98_10800 [Alphaproteobacteria bacterium]
MSAKAVVRLEKIKSSDARKKKSGRGEVLRLADGPTPERLKKDEFYGGMGKTYEATGPNNPVKTVVFKSNAGCWLDRYKCKGFLDEVEYAAGVMFKKGWEATVKGIKTHDSTVRQLIDGAACGAMDVLVGSERIVRLCLKKLTVAQRIAVVSVCGEDEALGTSAKIRTLRRGLEAISRHSNNLSKADNEYIKVKLREHL